MTISKPAALDRLLGSLIPTRRDARHDIEQTLAKNAKHHEDWAA
jgi:hypothetical protein